MAEFTQTKLFAALRTIGPDTWESVAELIASGEDVNLRGTYMEGYLHVLSSPTPDEQVPWVLPLVYQFCRAGVDPNIQDREGNTALHICSLNEVHHMLPTTLVRCGADPCILNKQDQDAFDLAKVDSVRMALQSLDPGLWRSVEEGNFEKTKQLVESWCLVSTERKGAKLQDLPGAELNGIKQFLSTSRQENDFVHACLAGDVKAVKEMMRQDVDIAHMSDPNHLRDDRLVTSWPLTAEVIRTNLIPVTQILLKKVDVNVIMDVSYGDPQPLFMWAIDATVQPLPDNILKILFKKADVSKVLRVCDLLYKLWNRQVRKELIDILFPDGMLISSRDQNGYTLRELIFLENFKAEPEQLKEDLYFVDRVVIDLAKEGKIDILEKFAYDGYEYINITNRKGKTVLDIAKKNEQKGVVKFLKKVIDIQAECNEMMLAIESANLQRTREVLNDKTVSYKDRGGRGPLHIAVLYERKFCIQYIVKAFPQAVHHKDLFGRTPLHYACAIADGIEFQTSLIKAGADKTITDCYGYTPGGYKDQTDYNFLGDERAKNYGREIYLMDRYLCLSSAIKEGNLEKVKSIRKSLSIGSHTLDDLHTNLCESFLKDLYRPILFVCLDEKQDDIAMYLMNEGATHKINGSIPSGSGLSTEDRVLPLVEAAVLLDRKELADFIRKKAAEEAELASKVEQTRKQTSAQNSIKIDVKAPSSGIIQNASWSSQRANLNSHKDSNISSRTVTHGQQNWNKGKNVGKFLITVNSETRQRQAQDGAIEGNLRSNSAACVLL